MMDRGLTIAGRMDSGARVEAAPIAIVGMGCMFPNAPDLASFWRSIRRGEDGIREVPDTHWSADDYFDPDPKRPDMTYCTRGAFLPTVPFDPTEFGIPPTILEATDTTQLLSLIVARAALEDAGYGEHCDFNRERVSVILGVTGTQELALPLYARLGHPHWRRALRAAGVAEDVAEEVVRRIAGAYVPWQENSFPGLLGNVVAGRIANRLNLRGTNCVVDAACASSLSAVHLAMLELGAGRCEMALAGGADTLNDIFMYMCFSKTPALSPTGDARPFSSRADGTVLGEGVGILVLKRLADAERDGDRIYAVLKGIGTSSDGRSQSIYAPHSAGQARALREAYRLAGVSPATIELVEAHGTGTTVGDATEFEALQAVYREARGEGSWCALGSIKSQIGHTKAAAGVAGLIKAALSIYYKALPPTIKVESPNPKLAVEKSPFYLSTALRPWLPPAGRPRRAAVSAFGFGGSNYHAVLEEHAATLPAVAWDGSVQIIALSADTAADLAEELDKWIEWAGTGQPDERWLAYRAAESRRAFSCAHACRLVVVFEREADVGALLREARRGLEAGGAAPVFSLPGIFCGRGPAAGRLAFLFPGQGSQSLNMARDLSCTFPELPETFAEAERAVEEAGERLWDRVYPPPGFDEDVHRRRTDALRRTDVAQPALGAVCLGMARILQRFGVRPDLLAGHSFGELVALCVAGRYDAATLHRLSRLRGRLMAGGDGGAMLAVKAPHEALRSLVEEERLDLVIANRNTPGQHVLSGDRRGIARAAEACRRRGLAARPLNVSGAFHSPLMEQAVGPFRNALEAVSFGAGDRAVFANTTGRAYPDEPAEARRLLAEQLIRPVDFVAEVENLHDAGGRAFVEVGPRRVLTGLVGEILADRPHAAWALDDSSGRKSPVVDLGRLLARLAAGGYGVDLARWERPVAEPRAPRMVVSLTGANYRARPVPDKTPGAVATRVEAEKGIGRRGCVEALPDAECAGEADVGDRRVEAAENGGRRVQDDPETVVDPSPVDSGGPAEGQPVGACPPSGGGDPAAGPRDAADREGVSPSPGEAGTELAGAGGEGRTGGSEEAGAVPEAVRLVREGLQAMQALQQQTAEAHRLFLEGQEQAHRSLQRLLEAQQCWLEPAGEAPPARAVEPGADEPRASARAAVRAPAGSGETGDTDEPRVSARAAVQAPVPPRIAHDRTVPAPSAATDGRPAIEGGGGAPADAQREAIANLVREVVCEKTGYPPEMVELEMDIEADLGVDSIKRVEIIAALEERVPGFGGVKPQQMGEIRTLDQIVGFVLAGLPESPGAEAAAPAPERASAAGVAPVLLDVVAELTGYPLEMLDLDMDLEADLGIDSIKRVEILSAVEARLPGMPPVQPERMGELRTLRQIVESCGADGPPDPPPAPPDCAARDDAADEAADEAAPGEPGAEASPRVDLNRRVLHAVGLPPVASGSLPIAPGHEIRVTDDDSGLSSAIVACLKEAGHAARLVPLDTESEAPPPDGDAAVGGLILVAPATGAGEALWNPATEDLLKAAFARVRNLGEALVRAAARGGAILATVSRMDGSFGLSGGAFDAAQGGLAGLLKTAAREWERVICRAIDVAPDWEDAEAAAPAVVAELASDGPMEVGLDAGVRRGLELKPAGVGAGHPAIEAGDVVVLTGGARGVTAEAALALARRFRPTLVLLGRTSLEEAEPAWLAGLETEREIKAAIREHAPADGRKLRPRELKAACREVMARREVRANRARLEATGAPVHYRSVDVCDAAAVRAALDEVRRTRGPVRGLIHGAGTLQDSSIQNKSPEQFATVLDTKVRGLRSLLSAVALEELRHVVLFSSVSGRCGNAGQADYAAANEVLNKAAQRLAARLPAARVVALNWGPWDGGMVGPALREAFLRSGVDLIPLEAGGQAVAEELADAQDGSVEVVLGASFDMPGCGRRRAAAGTVRPRPATASAEPMHLAFERELDVQSHPFLRSHVLDGRPVLPAAMMIEWLAHAAVHMNPGLRFQGLDDVRVLRGVVLNGRSEALRFYAARPRKSGERYDVEVALRGVAGDGTEIPHARANVVLAPGLRSEPVYRVPEALTERSYARGVRGAYAEVLFHGEDFRGIREVLGYSPRGMVAGVQAAEPPARWMTDPLRSDWLTDPLALDCAFQLAILWCHEELGAVSLPSCLRRYRQYRSAFPMSGLTVVLEVRSREPRRMTGDLTFVSEAGSVVAQIEGYECAVDAALRAAFRRGAGLETAR